MGIRSRSRWLDIALVILFLVIVYIFVIRRSYMSKVNLVLEEPKTSSGGLHTMDIPKLAPHKARDVTEEERDQAGIDEKIAHVPDFRSDFCKSKTHGAEIPTSIIIDFCDYSFYDMRVTITSITKFTPESLIREIIIVDDGSTLDYIIEEAKSYVMKIPKAVLLRNEEREGQGKARMRGAKEAMGANLVFIDSTAVVSTGWLEPLIEFIQSEKNVIAMPHHDRVNDAVSYDYQKTDPGVTASFTWSLDVVMSQDRDVQADQVYASPVIRGGVFAVMKEYWRQLRGLDPELSDGGGDVLELSLRTWVCGGSIKVIPCSRVGVLNYKEPVKVVSNKNKWRITELWLGDFRDLITKTVGKDLASNIGDLEKTSLETKKKDIENAQCREPIKWFFDNVAKDLFIPPANAKVQGFLQIQNGHCARVGRDMRIDLGSCNPDKHKLLPRDMIFVLTNDGLLQVGKKCLSALSSAYIAATDCNAEDQHQKWTYGDHNTLVNSWSRFCAMHVTDPDQNLKTEKRQIVMAQKCDGDSSKKLEFSSWKFLSD